MCHRIREAMNRADPASIGLQGEVVEADETFIGGKEHNNHCNKRGPRNPTGGKQAVVTLVERDGRARSFRVATVTAKTLGRVVRTIADHASHLMTDGARHHSNTVENFFSILKRASPGRITTSRKPTSPATSRSSISATPTARVWGSMTGWARTKPFAGSLPSA